MGMIDETVAKLTFDNQRFEKNIKTSINSLGRLDASLNKVNGADLNNLNNNLSSINTKSLAGMISNINQMSSRFKTMGIVGATAIANITTKAMGLASNLAKIATNPIVSGGKRRAFNLERADFQLQGLLKDSKKVDAIMSDVSASVDGTAYSLDAAANVASQFAATGMRAGSEMEGALKGVAGVAAMTGREYSDIGRIFTTVAGNGRLMGDQLLQLSASGLNAAATITEYLNKTKEGTKYTERDIRDMVSKGQISFKLFAAAMDESFGEHAKKANDTFTGAMSNIKAALGRIGADFFSPIIKNKGVLVQTLGTIRDRINDVHEITKPIAELVTTTFNRTIKYFNSLLKSIEFTESKWVAFSNMLASDDGPNLIKTLSNSFISIVKTLNQIKILASTAWQSVFPKSNAYVVVNRIVDAFVLLSQKIQLTTDSGSKIFIIFKGIFSLFHILTSVVMSAYYAFNRFNIGGKSIIQTVLDSAVAISKFIIKVDNFINNTFVLQDVMNRIADAISFIVSLTTNITSTGIDVLTKAFSTLYVILGGLGDKLKEFTTKFESTDKKVSESKIVGFTNTLKNALNSVISKLKEFGGAVKENVFVPIGNMFSKLWGYIKQFFKNTGEEIGKSSLFDLIRFVLSGQLVIAITSISKSLSNMAENADKFGKATTGFVASIKKTISGFGAVLGEVRKTLVTYQKSLNADVLLKIAKAIIIIAGALVILSLIPEKNLAVAIIGLSATVAALTIAMGQMTKSMGGLKSSASNFRTVSLLMASMGISVLLLSMAIKKVSDLNLFKMMQGVMGISAIMTLLVILLDHIKSTGKKVKGLGGIIISIGITILLISKALEALSLMADHDLNALLIATGVVLAIIGSLIGLVAVLGHAKNKMSGIKGLTLSILAIAGLFSVITNMMSVMVNSANTNMTASLVAIGGITTILLSLALVIKTLKQTDKESVTKESLVGLGFLVFGLSSILKSMVEIVKYPMESIISAFSGLEIILISIGIIVSQLEGKKISKSSLSGFIVLTLSIITIAKSISIIKNIKWDQMLVSILGLSAMLWQMVGIVAVLNKIKTSDGALIRSLVIFAGFTLITKSIAESISSLRNVDFKVILSAMVAISGIIFSAVGAFALMKTLIETMGHVNFAEAVVAFSVLTAFVYSIGEAVSYAKGAGIAEFAIIMGSMLTGVLIFASAMAILGAIASTGIGTIGIVAAVAAMLSMATAVLAFGAAVKMVGQGVMLMSKALGTLATNIAKFVIETEPYLADFTQKMSVLIVSFMESLAKAAPIVALAILNLVRGIRHHAPEIAAAIGDTIIVILTKLEEILPKVQHLASKTVIAFMQGIADAIPGLIKSTMHLIVQFIKGIIEGVASLLSELFDMLSGFGETLKDLVIKALSFVGDLPGYLIEGFIVGLFRAVGNLGVHIKNACGQISKEFCDYWGIHSPSTKMAEYGGYLIQGLINGIWDILRDNPILDVCKAIADKFCGFWEINSPSKKMEKYGGHLTGGLSKGITDGTPGVNDALEKAGISNVDSYTKGVKEGVDKNKPAIDQANKDLSLKPGIDETASKQSEKMIDKAVDKSVDAYSEYNKRRTKNAIKASKEYAKARKDEIKTNSDLAQREQDNLERYYEQRRVAAEKHKDEIAKIEADRRLNAEQTRRAIEKIIKDEIRMTEELDRQSLRSMSELVERDNKLFRTGKSEAVTKYQSEWSDRYGAEMAARQKAEDKYAKDAEKKRRKEEKKEEQRKNAKAKREKPTLPTTKTKSKTSSSKSSQGPSIITTPSKAELQKIGKSIINGVSYGMEGNSDKIKKSASKLAATGRDAAKAVLADLNKNGSKSIFHEFIDKSTQSDAKKSIADYKKERKDLQRQLKEARKSNDKDSKANIKNIKKELNQNAKNMAKAKKGMVTTLKQAADAYLAFRDKIRESAKSVVNSFEGVSIGAGQSAKQLMANLKSQNKALDNMVSGIRNLKASGISSSLLQFISKQDVAKANEYINSLMTMTESQLKKFNKQWVTNQKKGNTVGDAIAATFVGKSPAIKLDRIVPKKEVWKKVAKESADIYSWTWDRGISRTAKALGFGEQVFKHFVNTNLKETKRWKTGQKALDRVAKAVRRMGEGLYKQANPVEQKEYKDNQKRLNKIEKQSYAERSKWINKRKQLGKKRNEANAKQWDEYTSKANSATKRIKAINAEQEANEKDHNNKLDELLNQRISNIANSIMEYMSISNLDFENKISNPFEKFEDNDKAFADAQKKYDDLDARAKEAEKKAAEAEADTSTVAARLRAETLRAEADKLRESADKAKEELDGYEKKDAQTLIDNYASHNRALEEFYSNMDKLRSMSLDEDMLKRINDMGYEEGLAYTRSILGGGEEAIAKLNAEVKKNQKLTKNQVLRDAKLKAQQVKNFGENYKKMLDAGFNDEAINKLIEGSDMATANEQMGILLQMTPSEIEELSKNIAEGNKKAVKGGFTGFKLADDVLDQVTGGWIKQFNPKLDDFVTKFNSKLEVKTSKDKAERTRAVTKLVSEAVKDTNLDSHGRRLMNKLVKALGKVKVEELDSKARTKFKNNVEKLITDAYNTVDSSGSKKANKSFNKFKTSGENILKGLDAGLKNKKLRESLTTTITTLSTDLSRIINVKWDMHSPSKLTEKYGRYFLQGLNNGLTNTTDTTQVLNSTSNLADSIIDYLDPSNLNPTITPVVDMSEIQNGMNSINDMFDDQAISIRNAQVNFDSGQIASAADARRSMADAVYSAVSKVMDGINNTGEVTMNNTFNIDGSQDPALVAEQVNMELGRILRRQELVWA